MTLRRNIMIVAGLLAVTSGVTALALEGGALLAALCAGMVAAVNAVAAHALFLRSQGRPPSTFVKLVLGGMGVRMAAVLVALIIGLTALDLPPLPLVLSLLGHFVLFLGVEIMALRATPRALAAETR